MTAMVQTDLGPPTAAKYKEEPVDDPVSITVSYLVSIYSPPLKRAAGPIATTAREPYEQTREKHFKKGQNTFHSC